MDDLDVLDDSTEDTRPTPEPARGPTAEETEQRMVQIFGPTLGALGQRLAGIEERISSRSEPAQAAEPASNSAELDAFLENPKGTIESIAKKVAQETAAGNRVSPNLVNSVAGMHLMGERQRIDNEYGYGTFDKDIAPLLRGPLSQLADEAKVDPSVLHTLVTAAMGQDGVRDSLYTKRGEMTKLRNTPPTLMSNGMPMNAKTSERLTSEESELCNKVGMDSKVYLEMRKDSVMDLDAFEKMQSKMSAKRGAR